MGYSRQSSVWLANGRAEGQWGRGDCCEATCWISTGLYTVYRNEAENEMTMFSDFLVTKEMQLLCMMKNVILFLLCKQSLKAWVW